jgi:hypothetical protein
MEIVKIVRLQCENCKRMTAVRGAPEEIVNVLDAYQEGGYLWCPCGGELKREFSNKLPKDAISPAEFWQLISNSRPDPEALVGCTVQKVDYDKTTKRVRTVTLGVAKDQYLIDVGAATVRRLEEA